MVKINIFAGIEETPGRRGCEVVSGELDSTAQAMTFRACENCS